MGCCPKLVCNLYGGWIAFGWNLEHTVQHTLDITKHDSNRSVNSAVGECHQVADAMAKDHRVGTNHIKSSKTLQNYLDLLYMIYGFILYLYDLSNINLQPSIWFNEFHAHPCDELPHPARKHPFFQEGRGPQCQKINQKYQKHSKTFKNVISCSQDLPGITSPCPLQGARDGPRRFVS